MTQPRGLDAKTADLLSGLRAGNRRALARAITLVESQRDDHRQSAESLLQSITAPEAAPASSPASVRLGITGPPGAGKSTFIEAFGGYLCGEGLRVAVLAVDPSSRRSGGSILGDKTRMATLAREPNAFIRPTPSGGAMGGVAQRSRDVLALFEAAGYDVIIVETVGVGQSETAVADMVDFFLLVLAPAGGDDLQGIKRGIMELADLVLVNKADGGLLDAARHVAADYRNALHLLRPKHAFWTVPVDLVSAKEKTGIEEVWARIGAFRAAAEQSGGLDALRGEQAGRWLWMEIQDRLVHEFRRHDGVKSALPSLQQAVNEGRLLPSVAARQLTKRIFPAQ